MAEISIESGLRQPVFLYHRGSRCTASSPRKPLDLVPLSTSKKGGSAANYSKSVSDDPDNDTLCMFDSPSPIPFGFPSTENNQVSISNSTCDESEPTMSPVDFRDYELDESTMGIDNDSIRFSKKTVVLYCQDSVPKKKSPLLHIVRATVAPEITVHQSSKSGPRPATPTGLTSITNCVKIPSKQLFTWTGKDVERISTTVRYQYTDLNKPIRSLRRSVTTQSGTIPRANYFSSFQEGAYITCWHVYEYVGEVLARTSGTNQRAGKGRKTI